MVGGFVAALLIYLPIHAGVAVVARVKGNIERLGQQEPGITPTPTVPTAGRLPRRASSEELERFLPVVMERMVLAVQCGLDIAPALKEASGSSTDPVSVLLRRAHVSMERGLSLEQALREASSGCPSFAVRHAFLYLGLAHRLGGELASSLKELSDSTQIFYQERQEQRIAKLPVKATPWLLLSFAGLILFLLTAPLVQISQISERRSIHRGAQ